MGIYVDKRLEELGGERVFEVGLGDDDGKYVSAFLIYISIITCNILTTTFGW